MTYASSRKFVNDSEFIDPQLPARFAPFNGQRIGGKLYVTYALQDGDRHDKVAGAGNGIIDVFDLQRQSSNAAGFERQP
jgi:hypothetical protein